jgi:hypothetical protein
LVINARLLLGRRPAWQLHFVQISAAPSKPALDPMVACAEPHRHSRGRLTNKPMADLLGSAVPNNSE